MLRLLKEAIAWYNMNNNNSKMSVRRERISLGIRLVLSVDTLYAHYVYIWSHAFFVRTAKTDQAQLMPWHLIDKLASIKRQFRNYLVNTYKQTTIGPQAKCHSMAFRWRPDGGPALYDDRVAF